MKLDSRGLAITTDSDGAVHAIDHFTEQLLGMGPDLDAILGAADVHPDCAIIQAYAASMYVYAQLRSEAAKAAPLLDRARQRIDDLTERERLFVDGVAAGCQGDFERAISIHEKIARRWPRDVVAAKLAEFHFFQTGESARQLAFMQSIAEPNRDNSHLQSMYAFALELCGRREESEAVARAALRLNPATPWAQHCLAHVFAGQSRLAQGISELEGYADGWRSFGRYIQAHNWFHLATLYLANLDFQKASGAYRNHIWGFFPDSVAEQTDAILLLWYLELAGVKLDGEWREIAPHVRPIAHEQLFPFLNALSLFALSRAGERAAVEDALAEMGRYADRQSGSAAHVWREIGMPLVRGCVAFARRDYAKAASLIGPIIDDVPCVGGSDEQRGVFIQSNLVSLIKSGQKHEAAQALQAYIGSRAITPLERRWLEQI
jgi:tetratricopeptide (TPR) repeat protein